MSMVSKERIVSAIGANLQALSGLRGKQENLIQFAEMLRFSLRSVDQGLSHAIVMGGATGPGEEWPLHWHEARRLLSSEQVGQIEQAYSRIIEDFPEDLKQAHPNVFK
jgi:hypothetical protein